MMTLTDEQTNAAPYMAEFVRAAVLLLERNDYPRDGACDHFGVSYSYGSDQIGFMDRNGRLLITIYRQHWPRPHREICASCGHLIKEEKAQTGWPKAVHETRRDLIAAILGAKIIDEWNGGEGVSGISFVLNRIAPAGLSLAMKRGYIGHTLGCEKFDRWVEGGNATLPATPEARAH